MKTDLEQQRKAAEDWKNTNLRPIARGVETDQEQMHIMCSYAFNDGIKWRDKNPSRELVEKIIRLTRELKGDWSDFAVSYSIIEELAKEGEGLK